MMKEKVEDGMPEPGRRRRSAGRHARCRLASEAVRRALLIGLVACSGLGLGHPRPEAASASAEARSAAMGSSLYEREILEWRQQRQARLTSDSGWLTVTGLFWLKQGENRFGSAAENPIVLPAGSAPAQAGSFILDETRGTVRVTVAPGVTVTCDGQPVHDKILKTDADSVADVLSLNDLRLFVIKRSKGHAIRMRHLNTPARKSFTGLAYFPIDPSWRIEGRFIPYDPPRPIPIANIVGTVDTMIAPGQVEFVRDGRVFHLEPVIESKESEELFFIFRDETSGKETYPAGRFLYTPLPALGRVMADFNRAYNPPCAFTDFATCPLPPLQNRLKLRVTAGEMRYGHH